MLSSLLGAHNRVGKGPMSPELCFSTAIELARRIRAREVSVTEVVQAHLAQIERVNPKVNAIVTLTAERALAEAREEDGALARGVAAGPRFGLPVAHKDLALMLSVMAGPDRRSPIAIAEPGDRFRGDLGRDFKGVRIAWSRDLGGLPVDRRVTKVLDGQRATFETLGCHVEDGEPDFTDARHVFQVQRALSFSARYGPWLAAHGPQSPTESIRAKSGDTPAGDTPGPAGALAEPGGIRSPSRLAHAGAAVQRLTNAPTRFGRGRLQTVSRLRDEARAGSHERERTLGGLESLREASLVETQRVRQRVGPRRLPPQRRCVRIVHRLERRNLELGRQPRVLLGGHDRELRQRADQPLGDAERSGSGLAIRHRLFEQSGSPFLGRGLHTSPDYS